MNILDELRQKAAEKKRHEAEQNQRAQHLEQVYQNIILPKMQFLYDSLKELLEYLSYLEEPVPVKHYCPRYPQFGTLLQKNYRLNTDGRMGMSDYHRLMQINVGFSCEAEGAFNYTVSGKAAIDREYGFLNERNLKFQQKDLMGERALFIVERKIPVRFQILVDYPSSRLKVGIFNHENFQTFHKSFVASQLDDNFLDTFLSYFLRRDNRFVSAEISAEEKAAILDHIAPFYEELPPADLKIELPAAASSPVKNIFAKFNK